MHDRGEAVVSGLRRPHRHPRADDHDGALARGSVAYPARRFRIRKPGDRARPDDLTFARRRGKAVAPVDALEITALLQAYALFLNHWQRDDLVARFTADATWHGSEIVYTSAFPSGHCRGRLARALRSGATDGAPARPPLPVRRGDDRTAPRAQARGRGI